MARVLLFLVSCVFTQNVVFGRLLGACELGENRRIAVAAALGGFTALVMTVASALGWAACELLLKPFGLMYLDLLALVGIILLVSFGAKLAAEKCFPQLAEGMGESLGMIAANCAVLGIALLNLEAGYGLGMSVLHGLFGGLGFTLAIVLMAGVQDRIEFSHVPESLKGLPISLISASLIALAFMGFMGMA